MSKVACPKCGNQVDALVAVDATTAQNASASGNPLPSKVCVNCYGLAKGGTKGGVLMAQSKAKEQNKLMMWKNRVTLVKKGRAAMATKNFSEAAVNYEKYLRVLEMVFDAKPGSLKPEQFKDAARTSELTVVASVYWDLLRIYDTSEKYGTRQQTAAKQLAIFLPFTPIRPDIIEQAEKFVKTAKNPANIKSFLKMSNAGGSKCFIATAAFESETAPEVLFLRKYRDEVLIRFYLGQKFIIFYYSVSPKLVGPISKHFLVKVFVKYSLKCLNFVIKKTTPYRLETKV